jgi:glucose-1-phosphate cytidylyltransferase
MMHYSSFGFYEFAIALGYKGEHIKHWMLEHDRLSKNLTNKATTDKIIFNGESKRNEPDWKVDLVDTGQETNTGGRIKRLAPWLGNKTFMLTCVTLWRMSI